MIVVNRKYQAKPICGQAVNILSRIKPELLLKYIEGCDNAVDAAEALTKILIKIQHNVIDVRSINWEDIKVVD